LAEDLLKRLAVAVAAAAAAAAGDAAVEGLPNIWVELVADSAEGLPARLVLAVVAARGFPNSVLEVAGKGVTLLANGLLARGVAPNKLVAAGGFPELGRLVGTGETGRAVAALLVLVKEKVLDLEACG